MAATGFRYTGAGAMVALHERHMRSCYEAWKEAKAAGLALPKTEDPSYASLDALLRHVLRAARGYMTWMCEVLGVPDPGIREAPAVEDVARGAEEYLAHVLERWREPLRGVPEDDFGKEAKSRWGSVYCVDAMMEHAVMHPIRHEYQLRRLLAERGRKAR